MRRWRKPGHPDGVNRSQLNGRSSGSVPSQVPRGHLEQRASMEDGAGNDGASERDGGGYQRRPAGVGATVRRRMGWEEPRRSRRAGVPGRGNARVDTM
jgi:hypothetical protein